MNFEKAVQIHANWRHKFCVAIESKEMLDIERISADDCCTLGKWLYGEAKAKYSQHDAYKVIVRKHASFHKEAGKIAQLVNSKEFSKAESMLSGGSDYSISSSLVEGAIISFSKIVSKSSV